MSKRDNTQDGMMHLIKLYHQQKDYLRSMLANGEDLSKTPRIKVSTIHGAKGGEATNVVLFLNQTKHYESC